MARPVISDESLEALRRRLHDRGFITAGNPHRVSGAETVFTTAWTGRLSQARIAAAGFGTLAFEWGWLSGAEGGGESCYVELCADAG